jgi:ferrous iron transport protein A
VNRLSDLPVQGRAEIVEVEGIDDISLRLLEMGLTPGTSVVCLGAAPLGDPLELEVRGYRLSVRRSEAQRVLIRQS